MMGQHLGQEMNVRSESRRRKPPVGVEPSVSTTTVSTETAELSDTDNRPESTEGMIPRTVAHVFDEINNTVGSKDEDVEFVVRCSYVEVYLERIIDLLQPTRDGLRIEDGGCGETILVGASELCCLDAEDVYAMIARGNAHRTQSATEQNRDSSRSHAVFIMNIQQHSRTTGRQRCSRLCMLDLAGSEQGRAKSARQVKSPLAMEGRMINASLQSVHNLVHAKLAENVNKDRSRISPNAYANVCKLTKVLKPCIGGNCYTAFIFTISPSSYNIDETLNTIKFGQKVKCVRNSPIPQEEISLDIYKKRIVKSEERNDDLSRFAAILSLECRALRKTGRPRQPHNNKVWEAISKIAKTTEEVDVSDLHISVSRKISSAAADDDDDKVDISERQKMEKTLTDLQAAREKSDSIALEYQSEVTSLRAQHEVESKEIKKLEHELAEAKNEIENLISSQTELKNHLQTTQFRENEAIVFLRQIRSFYMRLLKSKAAQGSGDSRQVMEETSQKIPGAPDLTSLLDVDKLMMESGLLEKDEIGEDTNTPGYTPSAEAMERSAGEAEKAAKREATILRNFQEAEEISYRQRLVETPAGKLVTQKEKEIENDLVELSSKCQSLQSALNAEKATVEVLSARQGALSKMNAAREMSLMKVELERKTNDLQAIVWKMNELHLVNKTIDEKVEGRDHHVAYLEEHVADLQTQNKRLILEKQETEKKTRDECGALRQLLDGASTGLWQFGDSIPKKVPMPRIVLPCSGEPFDFDDAGKPERRMSLGDIAIEEIELLEPPPYPSTPSPVSTSSRMDEGSIAESTAQTEAETYSESSRVEIGVQTDEPEIAREETSKSDSEVIKQTSPGIETGTQTERNFKEIVDTRDRSMQTQNEVTFDASVQTDCDDDETITRKTICTEMSTQTTEEYPSKEARAKVSEIAIQTDREHTKICFEATTQTDDLPNEISVGGGKSVDGVSVLEIDDDIRPPSSAPDKWKPPKPNSFESVNKRSDHGTPDITVEGHSSFASLDFSKGYSHGGSKTSTSVPKWNATSNVSKGVQDRVGSNMSIVQGTTASSTDWRAKLRQKGEDGSSAPTPGLKEKANIPTVGSSPVTKKSLGQHQPQSKEVPEFLNKFRKLGIRADENEVDPSDGPDNILNETASTGPTVGTPNSVAPSKSSHPTNEPIPGPSASTPGTPGGSKQPEWMSKFKEIGMKGEEKVIVAAGAKATTTATTSASADDDNTTAVVEEQVSTVVGGGTLTKGPAPSVGARGPAIPKWRANLNSTDSVTTRSDEKEKIGIDSSGTAGPMKVSPAVGWSATTPPVASVPKWKTAAVVAAAATAASATPHDDVTGSSESLHQQKQQQPTVPKWKAGPVKATSVEQPSVPAAFQSTSRGPKWKTGSANAVTAAGAAVIAPPTTNGGVSGLSEGHNTTTSEKDDSNAPEWMKKFKQIGQKGQETVT